MSTSTKPPKKAAPPKACLEALIDADLDDLISEAAQTQGVSKTAFVSDAARAAALEVVGRPQVTLMAAEVFDQMMTSIDVADYSPELEELASLPRRISQ